MPKVDHETVLRHLKNTYLRTRTYFRDDCWHEEQIAVDELYNAHSDFRRFCTPPGERYVDIYPKYIAPLVQSGAISFMPEAALPLSRICCFVSEERRFVIDGSLRVFNAIQFGRDVLPAYVWREDAD